MTAYACPLCGSVSHHPMDAQQRYCGRCHLFADVYLMSWGLSPLEVMDGGWRVKTTDDGRFHLDVVAQIYGWLLVTTPVEAPEGWVRGWRYHNYGPGPDGAERTMAWAFRVAVVAARAWDGTDDTVPKAYDKVVAV